VLGFLLVGIGLQSQLLLKSKGSIKRFMFTQGKKPHVLFPGGAKHQTR
jgi:hypothetical protein